MRFHPIHVAKNVYLDHTKIITENQLQKCDLSEIQIEKQTLDQLEESLIRINTYIEKPETLLPKAATNPLIRPRIIHLLEARKRLVLEHLETLKAEQTVVKTRDLIYKVKDEKLRERLNNELDEFERQCRDLKNQLYENQNTMWWMILTRDTMVTIIFGIIGLVIVSAFVIGMFSDRQIPDVFSDFLLTVFGYLGASLSMRNAKDGMQQNHPGKTFSALPASTNRTD
jgi:hypothetical protein